MQNIKLADPASGTEMDLTINAEEYNHQQAWRVQFDGKTALLGIDQHGIWKQLDADGNALDSGLISEIGKAIDNLEH